MGDLPDERPCIHIEFRTLSMQGSQCAFDFVGGDRGLSIIPFSYGSGSVVACGDRSGRRQTGLMIVRERFGFDRTKEHILIIQVGLVPIDGPLAHRLESVTADARPP